MARQKTILIVDDDPDVVEATKVVLEAAGYAVETAANGEAGYQKALDVKPDLIILDVMMDSATEGIHTSYKLRGNDQTKDVPILMISAIEQKLGVALSPDTDEEYLPVDDFVAKPIAPDDLLAKVKSYTEPA